jgi:hypothetical protein
VANRESKRSREQQLKDLEVINEKRRQRKQELETERANSKNFKKEVWMFHQGLLKEYPTAVLPKQNIKEENFLLDTNIRELNVVIKGVIICKTMYILFFYLNFYIFSRCKWYIRSHYRCITRLRQ